VSTQWYDGLNRPTTWENTQANNVPYARSHYQFDNVGREAATWRDEQSSKGEKFWYTLNGQLAVAEYNANQVWTGNPSNWDRWVGYNYTADRLNRSSVNDNGSITNYVVSPLNQYTAVNGETVYHDGNFNVSMHGGWFYYYDAQNRLTSVRDWTGALLLQNTYDGLGRCVKRDRHDWGNFVELITYDGWKPIVEWDGAGTFQAWNVYGPGPDEILWRYQTGVGHLRYHHDRHGSVTGLLDYGGNLLEKYSYDAFGRPIVTDPDGSGARSWSNWGNRFMFTAREYFPGLWLYEYRNRWYDAQLARFLQIDPTGFAAGDMNLFRYCSDNPINLTDPTGLVSGYTRYQLVYDPNEKLDDTHDGYHVAGVPGFENKPGSSVHLEVDRYVTTVQRIDQSVKGGDTHVAWEASNKGGSATIHQTINVRYAGGAGPKTREFTRYNEWTHSNDAIGSANQLRSEWASWARAKSWSADKAVESIRSGDRALVMPSLRAHANEFLQNQWEKWDSSGSLGDNSWVAPNGVRVAPHNPIDASSGNPLQWSE
jgi:RHS repeat-associated protein